MIRQHNHRKTLLDARSRCFQIRLIVVVAVVAEIELLLIRHRVSVDVLSCVGFSSIYECDATQAIMSDNWWLVERLKRNRTVNPLYYIVVMD